LGVNSGSYSFPSEIIDDPLLDLVLPVPEDFENGEERRLFYVGLTRAKRRTYLLTKKSRISRFIPELLKPAWQGTVVYRSGLVSGSDVNQFAGDLALRIGYWHRMSGVLMLASRLPALAITLGLTIASDAFCIRLRVHGLRTNESE
jgi:hypothetical protein